MCDSSCSDPVRLNECYNPRTCSLANSSFRCSHGLPPLPLALRGLPSSSCITGPPLFLLHYGASPSSSCITGPPLFLLHYGASTLPLALRGLHSSSYITGPPLFLLHYWASSSYITGPLPLLLTLRGLPSSSCITGRCQLKPKTCQAVSVLLDAPTTESPSHSEHRFPAPSSKLCQIWLRH